MRLRDVMTSVVGTLKADPFFASLEVLHTVEEAYNHKLEAALRDTGLALVVTQVSGNPTGGKGPHLYLENTVMVSVLENPATNTTGTSCLECVEEVREGTRGTLTVWAARQRVWLWDDKEPEARCWWAVCTIDCESGDRKWFLSNAAGSVTLTRMVRKHADRYWIERAFQDAKTSLGMADYQARGWVAWQHHMSMVMLAMLFMIRERMLHLRDIELLSFPDLVELLTVYLPRADVDPEAIRRNIERRHRKRQASIESARRRQKQRPPRSRSELTK